MSLCILVQYKNCVIVCGDSRASRKLKDGISYAVEDNAKKIHHIGDKVIFLGGSQWVADEVLNRFSVSEDKSIQTLNEIGENVVNEFNQKYPDASNYFDRKFEAIVSTIENGVSVVYNLSSLENYTIKKWAGESKRLLAAAGTHRDKVIKMFKEKEAEGTELYHALREIYNNVADEEVGGTLTIYTLINENIIEQQFKIKDSKQVRKLYANKELNKLIIGPQNGFVAERSDKLARNTMNATYGNLLEVGDGEGNYTPVFYVAVDPADSKAKLYLVGDAVFTGLIEASDIVGGSINIGDGTFTVDNSGNVVANSGVFRGSLDGAGGTFKGELNAKDIIIGENNQDNGSINIRMEDYFITAKIAKIVIAGGTTITTLIIGKTTEEGSTPLNNINRVDLLAGTLHVYNDIYASGSINAASGKIDGVDIATHTWVDGNYLDKLTAAALATKVYVDDAIADAIAAHVAEYHTP